MPFRIVSNFFDLGSINNVDDIGDGDGGFGNVSGEDDSADTRRRRFEDDLLFSEGNGGVEQVDGVFASVVDVDRKRTKGLLKSALSGHDIVPAWKENEDVTILGFLEGMTDGGGNEGVGEFQFVGPGGRFV